MRKFIVLMVLAVAAFTITPVKAQDFAGRIKGPTTINTASTDTALVTISGSRSAIAFKYDISKTSGTVAGTIVLQAKLSTVTGEQWATLDTYTLTDATATKFVTYAYNPALYYRIITTITGTSVTVHNKYVLYRK
jgi:hypothetical protein